MLGCINAHIITEGCRNGIELWYHTIIPVLLPFILLTGLIINSINKIQISSFCAYIIIFSIGMLCGFPTGTMIISHFYEKGVINRQRAQILLPMCNNVSSMFLYGYIYTEYMKNYMNFFTLILLIYAPQISITAICLLFMYIRRQTCSNTHDFLHHSTSCCASQISAARESVYNSDSISDKAHTGIIDKSIHSITVIGVYMVIFSIARALICLYFPGTYAPIFTSFMEISQGLPQIAEADIREGTKIALMISLSSFGGLSAIFQSHDMIKSSGLSFHKYIIGKSTYSLLCYIIAYIVMR